MLHAISYDSLLHFLVKGYWNSTPENYSSSGTWCSRSFFKVKPGFHVQPNPTFNVQFDTLSCKTECMLCYFHFESRVVKIEAS